MGGAGPAALQNLKVVLGAGTVDVSPGGNLGGTLEVYEVKAQIFSGSIQGVPPAFNPGIGGINTVTTATEFHHDPSRG